MPDIAPIPVDLRTTTLSCVRRSFAAQWSAFVEDGLLSQPPQSRPVKPMLREELGPCFVVKFF